MNLAATRHGVRNSELGIRNLFHSALRIPHSEFRNGFTLPEILVVSAIFLVILGALFVSFLISQRSYESADAYIQVQQEARRAFDVMVRELREAGWDRTNKTDFDGGAAPFTITRLIGPDGRLDFQIALGYNFTTFPICPTSAPACCPTNAICWGAEDAAGNDQPGWSVRYSVDTTVPTNRQLVRQLYNAAQGAVAGTQRVLANNLESFNPSYDDLNRTITLNLSIRIQSGRLPGGAMWAGTPTTPLTTQVKLRNP